MSCYCPKHAEAIKARAAAWQNADLRRKRAAAANAKARRMGIPGNLDWRLLPTLPAVCHYCGGEAMGFDHVNPFIDGGPNTHDNVVPCCQQCNQRKNIRPAQTLYTGITHCPKGHEYIPENIAPPMSCRECHRIAGRRRWAAASPEQRARAVEQRRLSRQRSETYPRSRVA